MKNRRPEIVGDEIQKIVSTIISTKLKDPRVPLLTSVTSVKMEAIEHAKGFIRYETVQEINLRVAPEFSFKLDNTLNNALRMEALIEKTIKEDEARRLAREEREGKSEDSPAEE